MPHPLDGEQMDGYYPERPFARLSSAILGTFQMLIGAGWAPLMESGIQAYEGTSKLTAAFVAFLFIAFHIIGVCIVLNLVTALAIEFHGVVSTQTEAHTPKEMEIEVCDATEGAQAEHRRASLGSVLHVVRVSETMERKSLYSHLVSKGELAGLTEQEVKECNKVLKLNVNAVRDLSKSHLDDPSPHEKLRRAIHDEGSPMAQLTRPADDTLAQGDATHSLGEIAQHVHEYPDSQKTGHGNGDLGGACHSAMGGGVAPAMKLDHALPFKDAEKDSCGRPTKQLGQQECTTCLLPHEHADEIDRLPAYCLIGTIATLYLAILLKWMLMQ